ncbi:MAG TPA: response regulator transcription factor [Bryobacteraceae bacterium]|nr:response regulator transcription factor [Bryobacteraceae bacterium]
MPPAKPKIRVLIADDHAILRAGLKLLVDSQADMEVVAEAADGQQAVAKARESAPDVALIDLSMPRSGGMEALPKILQTGNKSRVVVLTMYDDPAYLRSALAAGASGYVLKRSVDGDLLSAIRAVHRGGMFIDPSLAVVLVNDVLTSRQTRTGQGKPARLLSERELQVLRLVARGFSSKQIAGQIFVSAKTVETYRARLLEKLGLRTRSDLVRYAVHTGLLNAEAVEK